MAATPLGFRVVVAPGRRPYDMRLAAITLLVTACASFAAGDVAHIKAAKAKLFGRIKHHKRGIFSSVPPFKLGHDIPLVTHSLVKPLVVTYPPTAAVAAVKVPLSPPLVPRFPIHGHKVLPHAHFGLKFPHHTKTVVVPKPDHHFHHHHHHVPPKPLVPVLPAAPVIPATPLVPVPQPSPTILHHIPAPSPSVIVPEPAVVHSHPAPIAPPPVHFPLKPFVPIAPIQPAAAVSAPVFPYAQRFPYVIRPGNAVQTSFFATYPRYPLLNYQNPLLPLPLPAPAAPVLDQVLLNRPPLQLIPHGGHVEHAHPSIVEPTPAFLHPTQAALPQPAVHLQPVQPTVHLQPAQPTVHLQPGQPAVHLQPVQPTVHVQPTQPAVALDHDGWSPVPAQPIQPEGQFVSPVQQEGHFHQEGNFHQEGHFPQPIDGHHFTQEQGTQVFEQHSGSDQQYHDQQYHDQQYHDFQHQLQHHIQQQIEQAQYEQHVNNQHQLNQEYGAPQQEYAQPNHDYSQQNPEFAQHAHEYAQHVQEYAQHGQEYAQTNEYNLQQPAQEYGAPQQLEGRSTEGEGDEQKFHNHIPLGLQPPIDRPLDHFR